MPPKWAHCCNWVSRFPRRDELPGSRRSTLRAFLAFEAHRSAGHLPAAQRPPPTRRTTLGFPVYRHWAGKQNNDIRVGNPSATGGRYCGLDLAWLARNASGEAVVDTSGRSRQQSSRMMSPPPGSHHHLTVTTGTSPHAEPKLAGSTSGRDQVDPHLQPGPRRHLAVQPQSTFDSRARGGHLDLEHAGHICEQPDRGRDRADTGSPANSRTIRRMHLRHVQAAPLHHLGWSLTAAIVLRVQCTPRAALTRVVGLQTIDKRHSRFKARVSASGRLS